MTRKDLMAWYKLRIQVVNGYHTEKHDIQELTRLNHLVMEASHEIHNKNMLDKLEFKSN